MSATEPETPTRSANDRPGDGDLDTRGKIHDAVVVFYREVVFDDLLAPVFGEVAEVDWAEHIPTLIAYWCQVLLGAPGYAGRILGPHRGVHEQFPFTPELFDRWYTLWAGTIDARWTGPLADRAKTHARRIGHVLAHRLGDLDWSPPTHR